LDNVEGEDGVVGLGFTCYSDDLAVGVDFNLEIAFQSGTRLLVRIELAVAQTLHQDLLVRRGGASEHTKLWPDLQKRKEWVEGQ
jgi:hypothetical protein